MANRVFNDWLSTSNLQSHFTCNHALAHATCSAQNQISSKIQKFGYVRNGCPIELFDVSAPNLLPLTYRYQIYSASAFSTATYIFKCTLVGSIAIASCTDTGRNVEKTGPRNSRNNYSQSRDFTASIGLYKTR